jgi:hypothetical protein
MTRSACILLLLCGAVASASPPTRDALGFSHKIINAGATMTVEITLKPRRAFDTVAVRAGSGVASLSPDCSFAGVTVGGSYVCRFDVTGKPTAAAMSVNIVAESTPAPHALVQTEIHHLSFRNEAYVRAAPAASSHEVIGTVRRTN